MSGEFSYANNLVYEAMEEARARPQFSEDGMGRALVGAVLAHYHGYRNKNDIAAEFQFLIDTLSEDSPVITRGC